MTRIIITLVVVLVSLSVFTTDGVTASGVHGNKILVAKECQDLPHFNCPLIAKDGDCKGHTRKGVNYGKSICQLSCGNCDPIEDDAISTDQICYPFGKQIIQVTFLNRYVHQLKIPTSTMLLY